MSHLTRNALDIPGALAALESLELGGTAMFVGSVRRSAEDGPVEAIEYSAYEEMAEAEVDRILAEAGTRWPGARLVACHRLGRVPAGDISVLVAAAAPHRDEAFLACRYVIEEVKRLVPIWKKEIYGDGTSAWRGNDGARSAATRA